MEVIVIFVLAVLLTLGAVVCGLAIWRRQAQGGADASLTGRLLNPLLPCLVALAVVSGFYAVVSLPFVRARLDQMTMGQLRELEAAIPEWLLLVADVVPRWYFMAAIAAIGLWVATRRTPPQTPFQRRPMALAEHAIAYARSVSNLATAVAVASTLAAALTLFGDGMAQHRDRLQQQLHQAEFRFHKGSEMAVREIAQAVVQQSIVALFADRSEPDAQLAAYLRAQPGTLRPLAVVGALPNDAPAAQVREFVGVVEFATVRDRLPEAAVPRPSQGPEGAPLAEYRNQVPRTILDEAFHRATTAEGASAVERRELAKELISGVLDGTKAAVESDPVLRLFAEAVSPFVGEVLATVASRAVLEPMLERLWTLPTVVAWREQISKEVGAIVGRVDTTRHWKRFSSSGARTLGGRLLAGVERAKQREESRQGLWLLRWRPSERSNPFGLSPDPLSVPGLGEADAPLKAPEPEQLSALDVAQVADLLDSLGLSAKADALRAVSPDQDARELARGVAEALNEARGVIIHRQEEQQRGRQRAAESAPSLWPSLTPGHLRLGNKRRGPPGAMGDDRLGRPPGQRPQPPIIRRGGK